MFYEVNQNIINENNKKKHKSKHKLALAFIIDTVHAVILLFLYVT